MSRGVQVFIGVVACSFLPSLVLCDDVIPSRPAAIREFEEGEKILKLCSSPEGSQLVVQNPSNIEVLSSRTLATLRVVQSPKACRFLESFDDGSGYGFSENGLIEWGGVTAAKTLIAGIDPELHGQVRTVSNGDTNGRLIVLTEGSTLRLFQNRRNVSYPLIDADSIFGFGAVGDCAVVFRQGQSGLEYCSMTANVRQRSIDGLAPGEILDPQLVHLIQVSGRSYLISLERNSREVRLIEFYPTPRLVAIANLKNPIPAVGRVLLSSRRSLLAIEAKNRVTFIDVHEGSLDLDYSFLLSSIFEEGAEIDNLEILDESGSIAVTLGQGQVLCVWNSLLLQGEESETGHDFER